MRGRWRFAAWALAVPALGLAAALTTATPGSTTSGYGPGTFAFAQTSDRGFSFHIYVSDTAGTGRRLLTTRRAVGRPAMSPDGRQVAFSGPLTDDSDGRYGIYVVNIDGTGLRLLTAPPFADFDPAWSPDGRAIAFTHNANGNGRLSCCAIGLMYANGAAQHILPGTTYGLQPTWAPNSRRVAYAAFDGLHAVNTDGSAPALLVAGGVSWPAWSPDGQRIAFVRSVTGVYSQVQLVGAFGGATVPVESIAAQAESPAWGLDGSTLYYVLFHGYGDEGRVDSSVWRSTAPGAAPGRLIAYGTGLSANVYGLSFFGAPPQLPTKPSSVSSRAGRLEVFVRGADSGLWLKSLNNSAWSGWQNLGGRFLGNPAVVSSRAGRLDVFVRATNSVLFHKAFDGTAWSSWESLGVVVSGDLAAVSSAPGTFNVFYRTGSALGQAYFFNGRWNSLVLGASVAGNPTAVSSAPRSINVFYRAGNGALWQTYYYRGWNTVSLGGVLTADPSAATRGSGRVDVAVLGVGGVLYVDSNNAGWRGFHSLGSSVAGKPAASFRPPDTVDVTVSGPPPYLSLLHAGEDDAGWHGLQQLPGPLGGLPETVSWGAGRLDVFYRGIDSTLQHRSYSGGAWSGVESLGGLLPAY